MKSQTERVSVGIDYFTFQPHFSINTSMDYQYGVSLLHLPQWTMDGFVCPSKHDSASQKLTPDAMHLNSVHSILLPVQWDDQEPKCSRQISWREKQVAQKCGIVRIWSVNILYATN